MLRLHCIVLGSFNVAAAQAPVQMAADRFSHESADQWAGFRGPLTADERLVPIFRLAENPITKTKQRELSLLAKQTLPGGFARFGAETEVGDELLRLHWRKVIRDRLPDDYQQLDMSNQSKIDAAIELVITRFLREYRALRQLYQREGEVQWGRRQVTDPYERLREACSQGPWATDPLMFQVFKQVWDR